MKTDKSLRFSGLKSIGEIMSGAGIKAPYPAQSLAATPALPWEGIALDNDLDQGETFKIKIPKGTARMFVSARQTVNKYATNKAVKAAALYFLLKSQTSSGKIQNWKQRRCQYASWLGVCTKSINQYLIKAEALGYLEYSRSRDQVKLFSHEQICSLAEVQFTGYHIVRVNTRAMMFLPLIFYCLEVNDSKNDQTSQILKKVLLNRRLATALMDELNCTVNELPERLREAQISSFKERSTGGNPLHFVNADTNRTVPTLAQAWNIKSYQTVMYWKRKLSATGIAKVRPNVIESPGGAGTFTTKFYTSYDRAAKIRRTHMPDEISPNPALFL